jgi:dihydroorotase
MRFDLLIKGGHTIDDAGSLTGRNDVAVSRDRIAAVAPDIPSDTAFRTIDATGLYVTPGLIDLHTHVYHGATFWGVEADGIASRSGVTSWVDVGSAGALTLEGLRRFVIQPAKARISAFLNISYIGLAGHDFELANLAYCDVDLFEIVANLNRDLLHGVKVRMGATTCGANGIEPMRRAVQAAERCDYPVMVHIAVPPPSIHEILALLRPGDIITHCYTGHGMKLLDDEGVPLAAAREAIDRGVILDIGHGAGSFNFNSAEAMLAHGLKPQAISTDVHQISMKGPMFDMPTCISKMLALGVGLGEAVGMASSGPASVLGMTDRGTLKPGALADIALFSLETGHFPLYDIAENVRSGRELLVNQMTILGGQPMPRGPAPAQAAWFEPWGTAGRDVRTISFQRELAQRGHTPEAMAPTRYFAGDGQRVREGQ